MTHVAGTVPPRIHTLHPGEVRCVSRGERLVTLLGSCVAVILTDPRRTVGAMCHIVHAPGPDQRADRSAAWGDVALDTMQRALAARGIQDRLCEAYVYGGGNMFPALYGAGHVGAENVRWTLAALASAGVRVLHQDLGGTQYRRLSWTVGPDAPEVDSVAV